MSIKEYCIISDLSSVQMFSNGTSTLLVKANENQEIEYLHLEDNENRINMAWVLNEGWSYNNYFIRDNYPKELFNSLAKINQNIRNNIYKISKSIPYFYNNIGIIESDCSKIEIIKRFGDMYTYWAYSYKANDIPLLKFEFDNNIEEILRKDLVLNITLSKTEIKARKPYLLLKREEPTFSLNHNGMKYQYCNTNSCDYKGCKIICFFIGLDLLFKSTPDYIYMNIEEKKE